ncbi:MAG: hypothetical protein A2951_01720 [Candidatus Buchananbacteria bacterium RIFCSPLOWO2_01_FULL_56_15]|uniref:Uncharacterized protein n=1 Tax=Candidatus Buchananbacteria bacterium RIFCSPLOWO2_01_FULL_56_15 TaxID=1797547 RepID=A0A1G1YQY4_9BACT|nr:MAG: hypothetical protein A2951_01720 [Candidatus Buchananbacteria bacterium RIFCSPLOWO2_01_FULL_56_15]
MAEIPRGTTKKNLGLSMIKAVIFDIDGVLLDSFEANLKFFQDLMIKFGYPPPSRQEFPEIFHLTMLNAVKKLTGLTDETEIKKIWDAGRHREIPYQKDLLKVPEGVEEVIKKLSARYSLGIVTSRVRESIYEAPQMAQLQKYFKVEISAYDTDKHKPDPEPLLLCAERLGVHPTECVYIGDVKNDVLSAKAARMRIIVYSKNQIAGASYCTSLFREIPKILEGLEFKVS